ncbi:hypothetical protein QWY99_10755 [Flavobacterium branchiarum]|uniref:YcxB-like protein domain-containing protein n=1 Tax=Flavobacterium branchiarum TaxID=1114870 RepID=A0ABV5FFQ9_9FLAO|nr:hypothetical protein [Flavobacterium branchiarum]MDN3673533.1 hypothetical protein [Flavobacterium branchiarum]
MKFDLPFKESITRKQLNMNFELYWLKTLKNYKRNLIISIIGILLGSLIVYGKGNVGYVFIAMGAYGILEFYKIKVAYNRSKRKYLEAINKVVEEQIKSCENSIWEFNEDYFGYKDYKFDLKIKWEGFSGFRIIEENLFLDVINNHLLSYILSKEEIGEEKFENLEAFIETKLKRTSH